MLLFLISCSENILLFPPRAQQRVKHVVERVTGSPWEWMTFQQLNSVTKMFPSNNLSQIILLKRHSKKYIFLPLRWPKLKSPKSLKMAKIVVSSRSVSSALSAPLWDCCLGISFPSRQSHSVNKGLFIVFDFEDRLAHWKPCCERLPRPISQREETCIKCKLNATLQFSNTWTEFKERKVW